MNPRLWSWCLGWIGCLLLLAGCGGGENQISTHPVSGTVTKGGQPLANVRVTLYPQEEVEGELGNPASGVTNSSGQFNIQQPTGQLGARPGTYKVTLNGVQSAAAANSARPWEAIQQQYQGGGAAGARSSAPPAAPVDPLGIPEEYIAPHSTTLTISVPLQNDWKIELP